MTLRDAITDLLAGRGTDVDPRQILAEYGLDDLPAESFSSALIHFAEQAPLELADALAPIVTRLSSVPFADGDLPPDEGAEAVLADGGDVFDLLAELDPSVLNEVGYADPSELDAHPETSPEPADQAEPTHAGDPDDHDDTFGSGHDDEADPDPFADDQDHDLDDDLDPVFHGLEPAADETAVDPVSSVDADDLGGLLPEPHQPDLDDDPSDLDFDLD